MVRLTIPALHSFRDLVLSAVSAAIDAAGGRPSTDVRDEIVSALSEAFNNVVIHAYRGVRGGTVEVRVDASGPTGATSPDAPGEASVEICLLDRGRPFDPLEVPRFVSPAIDASSSLDDLDLALSADLMAQLVAELPESGMGLFIMRSFMDDVSYQRGGGGKPNVLTLRKSWCPVADAVSREQNASFAGGSSPKKESSRSGWRMRSVAVPSYEQSTVGSLKRK